jgi:hypothetical protein
VKNRLKIKSSTVIASELKQAYCYAMQKPWIQDTLVSVLDYGINDAVLPAAALASAGKLSNQQARRARCYKVDHALRLIWLSDGRNCVAAVLTPAALQQVPQKPRMFGIILLALRMFNQANC